MRVSTMSLSGRTVRPCAHVKSCAYPQPNPHPRQRYGQRQTGSPSATIAPDFTGIQYIRGNAWKYRRLDRSPSTAGLCRLLTRSTRRAGRSSSRISLRCPARLRPRRKCLRAERGACVASCWQSAAGAWSRSGLPPARSRSATSRLGGCTVRAGHHSSGRQYVWAGRPGRVRLLRLRGCGEGRGLRRVEDMGLRQRTGQLAVHRPHDQPGVHFLASAMSRGEGKG